MEKYGIQEDDLISALRDEEHQLMIKMAGYMSGMEKTAEEIDDEKRSESRLHQVRARITEHDLKKPQENG